MYTYSKEQKDFIRKEKNFRIKVYITQVLIVLLLFGLWELLSQLDIINTFLYSSPSNMFNTLISLFKDNNLLNHIWVTLYEIIISFSISLVFGLIIASTLWWNKFIARVMDPYLTILNSLPKVALGPLIIIWVGASNNSIIVMSLMISLFITIINLYTGFNNVEKNYITLLKSMKANKWQIYRKVILPANKKNIINTMKINVSMNLIGVIMGELLVSKEGLGYLIMYGSQVFNINLVITSIIVLAIISTLLYYAINYFEKKD